MNSKMHSYALADITDALADNVRPVVLPPEEINELTQVRRTYEEDDDLVASLIEKGQMSQGQVAALTPAEAERYIPKINDIWGANHSTADLIMIQIDGKPYYPIIFAGHRRRRAKVRANQLIREEGRWASAEYEYGYRALLHFGITAEEAIELQFHENNYKAPPLHEEAEAAWRFYRYLKHQNPRLTLTGFGHKIGKSAEWVRQALRFCNLPSSIQSYVTGDNPARATLPYGILVNIARLAEEYERITGEAMLEPAMQLWVRTAILKRLNVVAFGREVTAYLEEKRAQKAGQISLFMEEPSQEERDRHTRLVVGQEMVRIFWGGLHWAKTVQRLKAAHVLGKESYLRPSSPEEIEYYSPGSPIRILAELLTVTAELTPDLAELSRLEGTGHYHRLLNGHPLLEHAATALAFFAEVENRAAAN